MNRDHWKEWIEGTGIAAIVASLVFVGLQLKQAQDIASSEAASQLLLDQIEWVNLVNQNRDVWIRGNNGDALTELETSAYRDLAQIKSSLAFFQYRQFERLGRSSEIFIADYAAYLHQNPGARREWERQEDEVKNYREIILSDDMQGTVESDNNYTLQLRTMVKELDRLYGRNSIVDPADRE